MGGSKVNKPPNKPSTSENRPVKRPLRSTPHQYSKHPKSNKYNIPQGSTIDSIGCLVTPGSKANSIASASMTSINSKSSQEGFVEVQSKKSNSKVKPIIVFSNYKVLDTYLNSLKLSPKPLMKILQNDDANPKTKIECTSFEHKNSVIDMLREKKVEFHTFAEPGNRTKLFVLKKFVHMDCEAMKTLLIDNGLNISKVTFLYDNQYHPTYLIHTNDPHINILSLQQKHRAIESIIVIWEMFDTRRKRPMPCRRCKRWGHSASNCNHPYRCIKCNETHEPNNCPRTNRDEGKPYCVNCGGDHPANSTSCPSYQRYYEAIQSRRSQRNSTRNIQFANPPSRISPHQRINNQIPTFSGVVSRSLNGNDSAPRNHQNNVNFFNIQSELDAIPNISETFKTFADLVSKLKHASDERHRVMILLQFFYPDLASQLCPLN
jgi:hypothetical protein